jgi:hypothetical protein
MMGKKRKSTHDILVDAPDLVLEIERAKYGNPWCDICQRPSLGSINRRLHITADEPRGVPFELDPFGHEPTHHQWYDTPSHEPVNPL